MDCIDKRYTGGAIARCFAKERPNPLSPLARRGDDRGASRSDLKLAPANFKSVVTAGVWLRSGRDAEGCAVKGLAA